MNCLGKGESVTMQKKKKIAERKKCGEILTLAGAFKSCQTTTSRVTIVSEKVFVRNELEEFQPYPSSQFHQPMERNQL